VIYRVSRDNISNFLWLSVKVRPHSFDLTRSKVQCLTNDQRSSDPTFVICNLWSLITNPTCVICELWSLIMQSYLCDLWPAITDHLILLVWSVNCDHWSPNPTCMICDLWSLINPPVWPVITDHPTNALNTQYFSPGRPPCDLCSTIQKQKHSLVCAWQSSSPVVMRTVLQFL